MHEYMKRLVEERARTFEELKALIDSAEAETRQLTGEEEEKFERLTKALDELDAKVESIQGRIEREKAADEARAKVEALVRPDEDRKPDPAHQIRSWLRGEGPKGIEISLRGLGVERHPDGLWEVRVLNTSDDAATVPTSFQRKLYEHLIENSAIRQTNVTVFTTDSGENLVLPKTTAHPSGSITAEGSAIGQSEPTFGSVVLSAYKYTDLVQVSRELTEDSGVDILGYLARRVGEALGNASGEDFVIGTGSSEPRGVITAGSAAVTGGTGVSGAPSADDLIDLFYSLKEPYQRNSWWLLRSATVGKIRKLKDANNQYLWQPGLAGDRPNTLLDRPYVLDPNVPAAATAATSIAVGDFSKYVIRDVGTVRFERSDEFAFDKDVVTFRAIMRTDGDLTDETGAILTFKGGTA